MDRFFTHFLRLFAAFFLTVLVPQHSEAFALLSHEAIVDEAWEDELLPLLKSKYPNATESELEEARAYLYGGSVMPDIGYSPFGSKLFSNLVHYVRTGDFMQSLLDESQNLQEYAFALGFLCHYIADCYGHPFCTNKAVPLFFPKAKEEFGTEVTYEQCKSYHSRTEFSFDIFQVANGRYESDDYHDFIGFKLSKPVLERAFLATYGVEIDEIFSSFGMAESLFRFAVRSIFPALTKASWRLKKSQLERDSPEIKRKDYIYRTNRKEYNKDHGKPGVKSMGWAFFIVILPKVGPLSALRFKVPDESAERLFNEGFATIVTNYKSLLRKIRQDEEYVIENKNWDTGEPTLPGHYLLADEAYFELLKMLEDNQFKSVPIQLKDHLLHYYSDKSVLQCPAPKQEKQVKKLNEALKLLSST